MGRTQVEKVREDYYRVRAGSRPKADFDQLYELFALDCNTFNFIASQVGLTRERVRQIYNKYFCDLFPRRPDGRARRKVCSRKKLASLKENWVLDGKTLEAAILANDAGLKVEPVWTHCTKSPLTMKESTKRLRINGHLCTVHADLKTWCIEKSKTPFYRLNRRVGSGGREAEFHIILLPEYRGPLYEQGATVRDWELKGIAIIPQAVLVVPSSVLNNDKVYYISAIPTKLRAHFVLPELDMWEYRDRWDLLK